jgi:hypothetical protein
MNEKIDVALEDPMVFQKLVNQVVASNLTIAYLELRKSGKSDEESITAVIDVYGAIWSTLDEIGSRKFEDEQKQD